MKVNVFLTICYLILACTEGQPRPGWKSLDFDNFSLEVPSTWRKFIGQGIDSEVGGITDGKDTLVYDYGMYSYRFTAETSQTHIITESNRDGFPTKMVKPRKPGEGLIGIYYNLGTIRLTLFGRSSDENTFIKIIESVKIK